MNLRKIKLAIYSLFLTNIYGLKMKNKTLEEKKELRIEYSIKLLKKLNIEVETEIISKEIIDFDKKYLIIINHKSILDPLVTEIALKDTKIKGLWIAKEQLAKSIFFGTFVRNAGTVLINRENPDIKKLLLDTKKGVNNNCSLYIFPEGNRNKSDKIIQEFKSGANVIAMKNKIDILPIYIETDMAEVSRETINKQINKKIKIKIGDLIDSKERNIEERYKNIFQIN